MRIIDLSMVLLVVATVTALLSREISAAIVIFSIMLIQTGCGVVLKLKTTQKPVTGTGKVTALAPRGGHFQAQIELLAVGVGLLIFLFGLFRGHRFFEMFLIGISLAVTVIPGGLPFLSTDHFMTKVKAHYFFLSYKLGVVMVVFSGILLGWPLPLAPLQLLWVNLMIGFLTAFAPGGAPAEDETRISQPCPLEQSLFPRKVWVSLALGGVTIALVTLFAFRLGRREAVPKGETMAFVTIGLYHLVQAYSSWPRRVGGQDRKALRSPEFLWGLVGAALLLLVILVIPELRRIFRVQLLSLTDWLVISGLALTPLLVGIIGKTVVKE
jgi:magnesium-transporting ATPase (P-type)